MKTTRTLILSAALALAAGHQAVAQQVSKKEPAVQFLLSGALELGGEDVAKVYFTDGSDQTLNTGQGGTLSAGLQYQFPKVKQLLLRGSLGIKYLTTKADNAHIRLTRVPLQFTANWMAAPKFRIGAGLVVHSGIRFKADGIGEDIRFKSASGPVFEVAYYGVGLSYTAMRYTDQDNKSYGANAVGLTLSGVFSGKKKN